MWFFSKEGIVPEENPYRLEAAPDLDPSMTPRFAVGCGYSHHSRFANSEGRPYPGPPRGAAMMASVIVTSLHREYQARHSVKSAIKATARHIERVYQSVVDNDRLLWYGGTGVLIVETEEKLTIGHVGDWSALAVRKGSGEVTSCTRGYDMHDADELRRVRALKLGHVQVRERSSELVYLSEGPEYTEGNARLVETRLSRAFGFDIFSPAIIAEPEIVTIRRRDVRPGTIFALTRKKSKALAENILRGAANLGGRHSIPIVADVTAEQVNIDRYHIVFFEPWAW